MEKTKLQTTKEIVTDPSLQAPAILTIGTVLWRWLSAASNVDFLLSINEEKFAVLFQFMHSTGWWLLALAGVVWLLFEWPRRKSGGLTPALNSAALVAACSFVAFLFGALVTIRATGSVPNIITAWGGPAGRCTVTFDTTRLLSFRSKYKIALACGVEDATTDKLEDQDITFSKPFTIVGGGLTIVAPYRATMTQHVEKLMESAKTLTGSLSSQQQPVNVILQFPIWYEPVLVPNEVSLEKVATLAELMRLGGKVLRPQYFR
jgi:hypothetical protein